MTKGLIREKIDDMIPLLEETGLDIGFMELRGDEELAINGANFGEFLVTIPDIKCISEDVSESGHVIEIKTEYMIFKFEITIKGNHFWVKSKNAEEAVFHKEVEEDE